MDDAALTDPLPPWTEPVHPAAAPAAGLLAAMAERARAGDLPGAIALGQAGNRALRDAGVAHYLPRLRAAAFAARPPARPGTPIAVPEDPFPGATGIPEIPRAALTPALLWGAIRHHGALLVRGLAAPAEAAVLAHGIDHVFAGRNAFAAGVPEEATNPYYAPFDTKGGIGVARRFIEKLDGVWTLDSPRLFSDLIDLLERHGVLDIAAAILGERPAMSVGKSTLRRARPDTPPGWHQDGAFLGTGVRSLNLWLALSPCGQDAPGLEVLAEPMSGLVDPGPDAAYAEAVGAATIAGLRARGARFDFPVFAPGDALLFDHLTLHTTGVRPGMTRPRWAIETWLFAPSCFPTEQLPILL